MVQVGPYDLLAMVEAYDNSRPVYMGSQVLVMLASPNMKEKS